LGISIHVPSPVFDACPKSVLPERLPKRSPNTLPEASGDWARLVIGEPPSQGTVGMNLK